jgi:predicted small secreted protein
MRNLFVLLLLLALVGCNTVTGAGKDLEKASEWTKEKMSK